ncbi:unnamed protein product [Clavelina lepadiformis]|uniref:Uncharacterized protein n=1 Tax=Clavelina lepadiformis TaxID=159417 RepID=A0ABP0GWV3_CLALP
MASKLSSNEDGYGEDDLNYNKFSSHGVDYMTVIFVIVVIACILLIIGALVFAIKQKLCGHCVIWYDDAAEGMSAMARSLKGRYNKIDDSPVKNNRESETSCETTDIDFQHRSHDVLAV